MVVFYIIFFKPCWGGAFLWKGFLCQNVNTIRELCLVAMERFFIITTNRRRRMVVMLPYLANHHRGQLLLERVASHACSLF
jgi:hypothetical protein